MQVDTGEACGPQQVCMLLSNKAGRLLPLLKEMSDFDEHTVVSPSPIQIPDLFIFWQVFLRKALG